MTKTTTFQTVMAELAGAFTTGTRLATGTAYAMIKEDAPAWLADDNGREIMFNVHAAIDDRFPDDWIYMMTSRIADDLQSYSSADEARDAMGEIADGLVDIYNAGRLQWLASHLGNADLCDEAVEELGGQGGILERIGLGQYLALTRIGDAVISACEAEADRRDTDAEDAEGDD